MARLIIPADFTSQLTLLQNIDKKNTELGANSPLTAFLNQQDIDLTSDLANGQEAKTHDTSRALLSKQSENYRQLRDNRFNAVWPHLTGSAQFLKSFYTVGTKQLGNWGLPATDSGKLNYPAPFTERAGIFTALITQHNSYPDGESPLLPYLTQQNIKLSADKATILTALQNNTDFIDKAQQSENETELRNQLWLPVLEHIRSIGNFLMKLNSNNPKNLGLWGFVVDDSPKKPKLRTSKIKPAETVVLNGLIIGGTLTNIGTVEVHLYRGKSTSGTPSLIHAGEQFGIIKGYSIVTIVNPSTLAEAKVSALTGQ